MIQFSLILVAVFLVVSSSISKAEWTVGPSTTGGPLSAITSIAVGTDAVFAGGFTQGFCNRCQSPFADVNIYDSVNDTWIVDSPLAGGARWSIAAAQVGAKAIFAGGTTFYKVFDTVDVYDSITRSWSQAVPLAGGARTSIAVATVGHTALFVGGSNVTYTNPPSFTGGSSDAVDIYDALNDTWSQGPLLAGGARHDIAVAVVGSTAIFAGGYQQPIEGPGSPSDAVDIYHPSLGWRRAPPLAGGPRSLIAAITVGTKALFAGGMTASGNASSAVDIYDSVTDTWSVGPPLAGGARYNMGVVSIGGKAIFAGGVHYGVGAFDTVDIYDSVTDRWSLGPPLAGGPRYQSALVVGGKALFPSSTSAVDIYELTNDTWTVEHPIPSASVIAAVSVAGGRKGVFIFASDTVGTANRTVATFDSGYTCPEAKPIDRNCSVLSQSTKAPSLQGGFRFSMAATSVCNKGIFAGGSFDGNSMSGEIRFDTVDIFDATSNTWSIGPPLAGGPRYGIAAVTVGTKALFAGGVAAYARIIIPNKGVFYYYGASDAVDMYDARTDLWDVSRPFAGRVRNQMAVTVVGSRAIFAGGEYANFSRETDPNTYFSAPTDLVDIYDADRNVWTEGPRLAGGARYGMNAITVGTKAIFAAGRNISVNSSASPLSYVGGLSDRVDLYDSSTDVWSVASLPSGPRNGMAVVAIGSKAIFAGGYFFDPPNNTYNLIASDAVDVYDSNTDTWQCAPPLAGGARYGMSAAVVGDKAIFAGGYNSSVILDAVDIYDSGTNSWSVGPPLAGGARVYSEAIVVGSAALFPGVEGDNATVDIYDSCTNEWRVETLFVIPQARNVAALAVGHGSNGIVVFGGGQFFNETYVATYKAIAFAAHETTTLTSASQQFNSATEYRLGASLVLLLLTLVLLLV